MGRQVIVIGAGGHSRVLIDALLARGVPIIGATDARPEKWGTRLLDVPVLGGDACIDAYSPQAIELVNGVGSTASQALRKKIYEKYKNKGYMFASVLHPSCTIGRDVRLAEGVQVMAGAVIQTGTAIGENVLVNTKVSIDHDCDIGNHVHIAPGVTLSGSVTVGPETHIGTGASIIHGVSIGRHALIAAGTVVIRSVPNYARVKGVPGEEFK